MRLLFLVLLCVAVVFFGLMAFGGNSQKPSGPLQPPAWVGFFGPLALSAAPGLEIAPRTFTIRSADPTLVSIGRSDAPTRIAKFTLAAGTAARIVYQCGDRRGDDCVQALCLTASKTPSPFCRGDDEHKEKSGSLVVRKDGGVLSMTAESNNATVELR